MAAAWLLVCGLGAPAAASDAQRPRTPAVLTLTVNAAPGGELLVLLDGDEVWADADGLARAGLVRLDGERTDSGGRTFIRLSSIHPRPSVTVDPIALTLTITADPSLFPGTRLALAGQRPAGIAYHRATSAFVNYGVSGGSEADASLGLESGVTIGPALLTASAFFAAGRPSTRGLTSMTIDERTSLRRWVVGDAVAATGGLGGGIQLAGLSVSRDFSLDPYFIRYPTTTLSGVVTTPSRLELYVNNQLVRTLQVQPGQYELTGFALPTGSADTRVVVRDAFGGIQEFGSSSYVSATVLARGLHQYHYAAGAERLRAFADPFAYGGPVATAVHRTGLTDAVTAGGRLEVERGLASGGPTLASRLGRAGALEIGLAASRGAGTSGSAASLAYEYAGRRAGVSLAWRGATAGYETLSTRRGARGRRRDLLASVNLRTSSRSTLGLTWQAYETHDRAERYARAGLTASMTMTSRASLFAALHRSREDGRWSTSAYAGLSVGLGPRASSSVSYEHAGTGGRVVADLQRAVPVGTGLGYRVQAAAPGQGPGSFDGELRAQTRWLQATAQHTTIGGRSAGYAQITGALVAIGGRVLPSRPVQDGFALVRLPDVGNVRAYVSQQEVGRTDRRGDLLVPNLLSYYGNVIGIADEDVPVDRTLATDRLLLAPPYRGGAIAEFPVTRDWRAAGRLAIARDPLALRGQRALDARLRIDAPGGPVESLLGLDGEFYLEGLAPGAYDAVLSYPDGACSARLVIPDSDAPVIRVGLVTCRPLEASR